MLNKGANGETMVFEPSFIQANVGDTLKFVPVNKGHSVDRIRGKSVPEGAKVIKGRLNKELVYKLDKEGAYAFSCKPHLAMGMVGLAVAGKPTNLEDIKALKIRGKKSRVRFKKLLEKAEAL